MGIATVRVQRYTDHVPCIVNAKTGAVSVRLNCAEVLDGSILAPKEALKRAVLSVRGTNDLPAIIYCNSAFPGAGPVPPRFPSSVALPSSQIRV